MNIESILQNTVKNKTKEDLDPDNVENWLKSVPVIRNIDSVEKFFFNSELNSNELLALRVIIRNKYVQEKPKEGNKEVLFLFEDESFEIDISGSSDDLIKFHAKMCRKCEKISLPKHINSNLEMFVLGFLPKLNEIYNLGNQRSLKLLEIVKCNKFEDYNVISNLKNLIYLNLSDNKNLHDVSFLSQEHNIGSINLSSTPVLKSIDNVYYLQELPKLKEIQIKGTEKELMMLREAIPEVFVNGYRLQL